MFKVITLDAKMFPSVDSVHKFALAALAKEELRADLGPLCIRGQYCVSANTGGFWVVMPRDKILAGTMVLPEFGTAPQELIEPGVIGFHGE